jgi:adenosylcobyric acid synthase
VLQTRTARRSDARVRIVVPKLPRISNFDDLDPLSQEPAVDVRFLAAGEALPGDTDLVILPGSKATLADLAYLRAQGWDIDIMAHVRRGGRVLGVCGGYQMLGQRIADPDGIEGPPGEAAGLGLLDVDTVLRGDKVLRPVRGHARKGEPFHGYEMHVGRTTGSGLERPFLTVDGEGPHGAISDTGRVAGAYIHGLFESGSMRAALLRDLGVLSSGENHGPVVEAALDDIAAVLDQAVNVSALAGLAGLA